MTVEPGPTSYVQLQTSLYTSPAYRSKKNNPGVTRIQDCRPHDKLICGRAYPTIPREIFTAIGERIGGTDLTLWLLKALTVDKTSLALMESLYLWKTPLE